MRVFIGLVLAALLTSSNAYADTPLSAFLAPSTDETSLDITGSDETDALFDCYERFRGPSPYHFDVGPPRITRNPKAGYILRADYNRDIAKPNTVDRLVCTSVGSIAERYQSLPPLYPPNASSPDGVTTRVMAGWIARRDAEHARDLKRYPAPDSETINLLQGIWLVGRRPEHATCLTEEGTETQIEFEFRMTGGRVLIYEPYDLFTAVQISGIEKSGDGFLLQGAMRNGDLHTFMRIRDAPDHLEILPIHDPLDPAKPVRPIQNAYRCGDPDLTVNETMSPEQLAAVAPPVSGGWALRAEIPGNSDADICQGNVKDLTPTQRFQARWLQIELYGPLHYFVLGWNFQPQRRLAFDYVRAIKQVGKNEVKLEMQEHLEKSQAWDVPETRGKSYELTLIDHGENIEIPELAATFAKCKPSDSASIGIHRW